MLTTASLCIMIVTIIVTMIVIKTFEMDSKYNRFSSKFRQPQINKYILYFRFSKFINS